ncbi:MFS transporter [Gluconacetobacter takamatsuzukensis]|uniref:MFS transporter n=1 Tax=Gluconacetobacter takamatsuzukensis TaxID=1286190 RepID=A0A7W4KGA0_9PROT|nr:MFS transporter [Gluconacetobacter takamatsuzukensis]MBB2206280.1 MFS transporter [Gluconacetobacter takamatsuzukensis]
MDGFDFLILGFILPALVRDLHLSLTQGAWLVSATLFGTVAGGLVFGLLSDALGRVRVLAISIVLFALFTGLCGIARSYPELLAYRVLAGAGLGGEFGIGMALVAESWPPAYRARASSYVGLGWQAGVFLAAVSTPILLPTIGWRGMFLLGAAPALVAALLRSRLPEPTRAPRPAPTGIVAPLRRILGNAPARRNALGILILCSVQNFCYYGVMIWLPNDLATRFGYSLTRTGLWTAMTVLGMAAGMLAFGQVADRVGRRTAFRVWMLGAATMVIVYSRMTTPLDLLLAGAAMGFFVNGMIGGYGALISDCYPAPIRATAQNLLFNAGRLVGGFGPVAIGTLAASWGVGRTIALLSLLYLLDLAALSLVAARPPASAGAEQ